MNATFEIVTQAPHRKKWVVVCGLCYYYAVFYKRRLGNYSIPYCSKH